ncbi:MAG TPA: HAD family hydrolase [Vicinamibacterales bacterium]|nr:HAD family hydrolase [Vicinamibacterales bacterium]
MKPTVFLDRDGTINEDVGYLNALDRLVFIPGALDAIRLLTRADYQIVVITNQAGVALGMIEESVLDALHARIDERIRAAGGRVDGWFVCPHHATATVEKFRLDCDCRKPKAGLFDQACKALPVDKARSFYIGDKASDMGAAEAAGLRGILVRTGYGEGELARLNGRVPGAALVAANLAEAASRILLNEVPPA